MPATTAAPTALPAGSKGRPVFEVDFPATSRRKARIVARASAQLPSVDVRRVEVDFATDSLEQRLREAGFRPHRLAFFVWEGVSMYLTRDAVKATLATIRDLTAARSELVMDYWHLLDSPDLLTSAYRLSANLLSLLGEPVTFGIHPEDVSPFLARLGYRVLDLADASELERRYVRDGRQVVAGSYLVHAATTGSARRTSGSLHGGARSTHRLGLGLGWSLINSTQPQPEPQPEAASALSEARTERRHVDFEDRAVSERCRAGDTPVRLTANRRKSVAHS